MRVPVILVTGADGQLGRSLQALAKQQPLAAHYVFATRQHMDLGNEASIVRFLDQHPADCLINAAAYTAVDQAASHPEQATAINAQGPQWLAQQCAARHTRLLHVSTDYVFDGQLYRPYQETDTPAPLNTYGRSKWEGEQAVMAADSRAIVVRTSWVFSAWGANFVRTMLNLASRQTSLRVVDDQIGNPTWAGHLAQALHRLALHVITSDEATQASTHRTSTPTSTAPIADGVDAFNRIYHFCGTPTVSWKGFAEEIFRQAQASKMLAGIPTVQPVSASQWPSPEPRPANSRLDCSRIEALLGPVERDWRLGLAQVLQTLHTKPGTN
ncbi:dTDP-4-dehydrorhamnose reductase [Castellaniella sp.]|uniref:dTDP-4-dehydrorhamnose reductase n=1 Tax=Castellaniella sp. TaxID=1955812 RepID=UPI003C75B127